MEMEIKKIKIEKDTLPTAEIEWNMKSNPDPLYDALDMMPYIKRWMFPEHRSSTYHFEYTRVPGIDRVIFNDPATIVMWSDGSKTVVKCQEGDTFDEQTGLALCFMKKALGNKSRKFNDILHAYIPEKDEMKLYADNEVIATIKKE